MNSNISSYVQDEKINNNLQGDGVRKAQEVGRIKERMQRRVGVREGKR